MQSEQDVCLVFWFAMLVARSMGFDASHTAVCEQLRSVAQGELTLMASPAEVRDQAQRAYGRPFTAEELAVFEAEMLPKNRAEQDAGNRKLASLILRLLDERKS